MTTVIVSGAIANKPFNGGDAWTRLNYLLGLRKLGFEVYFVEQIQPEACIGLDGKPAAFDASANRSYFRSIIEQFALTGKAALVYGNGECVDGLHCRELLEVANSAALLVNISGHLTLEALRKCIPHQAYIDLDPGFT